MAFHGYTPKDYAYGRRAADEDISTITEDATPAELARVAERFAKGSHTGIEPGEQDEVLGQISRLALAQSAAAVELGLVKDALDYRAVGSMTLQNLNILDLNLDWSQIHRPSADERETYGELLKRDT